MIPTLEPSFMLYSKKAIDDLDIGVIKYFYSESEMKDFVNRLRVAKLSERKVIKESYVPVPFDDLVGFPDVVDLMLPFD